MVKLVPYTNPFDPLSIAVSIIAFIIHIAFLLILGVYSRRTYKIMVGDIEKAKMMFIYTAFFSLGIGDIFYFLSFLILTITGSTGFRIEVNGVFIYPYGIFEALFRSLAIIFLVSMLAYSTLHLKGKLTRKESVVIAAMAVFGILIQALPYNYFGFKVEGAAIFIRPYNDLFIVLMVIITIVQNFRMYIKTAKYTTDILIKRRRFSFFFATFLVSIGIIGVSIAAFIATVSATLILILLAFELFILLAPPILYYLSIFASDSIAKKFLMVK